MPYQLELSKENFKFSASHFTIFSKDRAEPFHGHNYQVSVTLEMDEVSSDLEMNFEFKAVKDLIRELVAQWDESVLLPKQSPFLTIEERDAHYSVKFHDRHYSFPVGEVRLLPISNITAEGLARCFWESLHSKLDSLGGEISFLSVGITETSGQKVTYYRHRKGAVQ